MSKIVANTFRHSSASSDAITLDSSGNCTISGDLNVTGSQTLGAIGQHFLPSTTNTYNLGSSSKRWANLYVNDAHFSNEGKTNSVDGTWGDWTLQEGEEDIFMINNRSGKTYKLALLNLVEEV